MQNVHITNRICKILKPLLFLGVVVIWLFHGGNTLAFSGQVSTEKESWQAAEDPSFHVSAISEQAGFWDKAKEFILPTDLEHTLEVRVISPKDESKDLKEGEDFEIIGLPGDQEIALKNNLLSIPGRYQMEVRTAGEEEAFVQEFAWGVLAINPNKSIYDPQEKGKLAMAVLDEKGAMVCDAQLELRITNQALGIDDVLSTENGKIIVNAECQLKDFTLKPDYEAEYQFGEAGTYALELEALTKNGTFLISDSVEVREEVPFDVERITATRIYPLEKYPVTLNILANEDFDGEIKETVPASFEISKMGKEGIKDFNEEKIAGELKTLIWKVEIKKGEKISLGYKFKAPDISPEFYLLGPLQFTENNKIIFAEARQWQIAADAVGFLGSTQINVNNGGNATLDLSGLGLQQDDLVIVAYSIADADNADMAMAETGGTWTEVADLFSNDTYDANLGVYYKVMGASPDASVTLAGVGGSDTDCSAVAMAFRGVDPVNPMDFPATTISGTTLSTMHANPPAINHNNPSGVWTVIAGSNTNGVLGAQTFTFPAGYTTNAVQQAADDTVDGIVGMGYRSSGVSDPEDPGVMTASGTDNTGYTFAAVTMALRPVAAVDPTLTISQPPAGNTAVAEGSSFNVTYTLTDPDSAATAAFYYDTNNDGVGGTAMTGACATAAEGTGATCSFDTSVLTPGTPYYVYGITSASPTAITTVSAGTITVNDAPTLTVSQPPAGNTAVAEGSSYNVTYTLADTDNIVTAAFYYDTNNDGVGGTAMTGACATAAEGTGATCSFDTSVLTPGTSYYIYGVVNDGVNGAVTGISAGTIMVNDIPVLTISQPPAGNTPIAENSNYNVTYTLTDVDDIVTAAFYYDTNNDGVGGVAITGACATATEGTGATCSFNTSVLTPGTPYYVYGVADDGTNSPVTMVSSGTITVNDAPTLSVSQPDGTSDTVAENASFNITYTLADTDNIVTAAFYYDTNNSGLDGTVITGACATAAEGAGVTCSWDTTGVTPGSYYVYGITNDGVNSQVSAYSSGQITIDDLPTLSISEPNGTGDTVAVGSLYDITYSLADTDDIVTAAFYYDTDGSGLDGVAITGACATAAEGAGVTCSWDTTGMTTGSYYVYAITNDGLNPDVTTYSSGMITINPAFTLSGTSNSANGTIVKVAYNNSLQGSSGTVSGGNWDIPGVSAPNVNDIVTVFATDGDGDIADGFEATSISKYSGSGDLTGLVLNTNVLSIGGVGNQSISLSGLVTANYDADQDEDIMFDAETGSFLVKAAVNTYSTEKIDILSSDTFTIGNGEALTTYDLDIHGTLTSGTASTYAVSGSWTNSGTFNASTSTVTFNASATGKTIDAGGMGQPFYHVEFNHSGGGWTIQTNDMKVTGNLAITDVSDWTLASGRTLEVDGTYSIANVETVATTWTGSTFYLNSSSAYTVGSKNQSNEDYSTLQIGANTDIRLWNSSAVTYTVNASGSLYSQDHDSVNGDLYIWGDYHVPTNDYWSYATDFDGTALGGSSRQVDVEIDINSTVTAEGGDTLAIIGGISPYRTIVGRQGYTDGYNLVIDTGTISAQYADFHYLDGNKGLDIRAGSTVTSLDYTKFDNLVGTAGTDDAFITIASSVIGTSTKTLTGMQFDNSGSGAEFNVNRTGADNTGVWTFSAATGLFDGEAFDGSSGSNEADPGMLVWTTIDTLGGLHRFEGSFLFEGASIFE